MQGRLRQGLNAASGVGEVVERPQVIGGRQNENLVRHAAKLCTVKDGARDYWAARRGTTLQHMCIFLLSSWRILLNVPFYWLDFVYSSLSDSTRRHCPLSQCSSAGSWGEPCREQGKKGSKRSPEHCALICKTPCFCAVSGCAMDLSEIHRAHKRTDGVVKIVYNERPCRYY